MSSGVDARAKEARVLGPILLVTAALYALSLHGQFVYDDIESILVHGKLHDLRDLGTVIFSGFRQIRVIQNLSLAIDWAISGPETWSFHLTNLLIHLANTALAYRWLRREFPERRFVAGLATFLFAVHPLQIQGVAYIMGGRISAIPCAFLLVCLNLLAGREARKKYWVFPIAAISLLAKESCVLLPVILTWYELTVGGKRTVRELGWKWIFAALGTMALFLPLLYFMRDPKSMYEGVTGFGIYPYGEYLLTQGYYFLFYAWLLFFSGDQSVLHEHPVFSAKIEILGAIGLLAILALAGGTFAWRRKAPMVSFLLGTFFIILGPTNTFVEMINPFGEYRLYAANLCLFVLAAMAFDGVFRRPAFARLRTFVLGAIVLGFAAGNFAQQMLWSDSVRLLSHSVDLYPDSYLLNANLAQAYNLRHDWAPFEHYMLEAERLAYRDPYRKTLDMGLSLANYYIANGRFDEGISTLDRVEHEAPAISGSRLPREYFYLRLRALRATDRRTDFEVLRARALAADPAAVFPAW